MRTAELNRKTTETDIAVRLDLDGNGNSEISTGCGFLDHMLTLFAKHGRIDLNIKCKYGSNIINEYINDLKNMEQKSIS